MKAEVTFLAPNTRVNSNHLGISELALVAIYSQSYGGKGGSDDGDVSADRENQDTIREGGENRGDPTTDLEDRAGRAHVRRREGEQTNRSRGTDTAEPTEDELPQSDHDVQKPHKGRGGTGAKKLVEVTGDDLRKGLAEIELPVGLHYITLVAKDTDGRESDASHPFRMNVPEDGTRAPTKETAPQDPAVVVANTPRGNDPDRPSLVTKVNVRLL